MTSALRRRYASTCCFVASAPRLCSTSNLIFGVSAISSLTIGFFPGSDMRCLGDRVENCEDDWQDVRRTSERTLSDGLFEVNIPGQSGTSRPFLDARHRWSSRSGARITRYDVANEGSKHSDTRSTWAGFIAATNRLKRDE